MMKLAIVLTLALTSFAGPQTPALLTASIDGGEGSKAMTFSYRRIK